MLDRKRLRLLAPPEKLYPGNLINAEHCGKSASELTALWDAAHPDDPVEDA